MPKREVSISGLTKSAQDARRTFLTVAARTGALHIGSSLSDMDILICLYGHILRVSPDTVENPERDRFILSKGHAALGLYVVLAQYGFLSLEEVEKYGQDNTRLAAHPVLGSVAGIEATSGSLGHGLPIGLGMALAAKRSDWDSRYVVLLSDGECDEGSNWEAILLAGHVGVNNLIAIVDYNKIQSFGTVKDVLDLEPFGDKWRAARWNVEEVDGHSFEELSAALSRAYAETQNPTVIIAHTVKGKGISYMENKLEWHYKNLSLDMLEETLAELQ